VNSKKLIEVTLPLTKIHSASTYYDLTLRWVGTVAS